MNKYKCLAKAGAVRLLHEPAVVQGHGPPQPHHDAALCEVAARVEGAPGHRRHHHRHVAGQHELPQLRITLPQLHNDFYDSSIFTYKSYLIGM